MASIEIREGKTLKTYCFLVIWYKRAKRLSAQNYRLSQYNQLENTRKAHKHDLFKEAVVERYFLWCKKYDSVDLLRCG
jgi:hypothetical protein